jgi:ABC-type dipeptide/oligopeptide/nickel transport system ATPase subunit
VYRRHKHLLDRIHFKELSRQDDYHITLDDFSADDYLHWLDTAGRAETEQPQEETVLDVGSRFRIFNRQLTVFRDENHNEPANLVIHKGAMVYLKAPSGVGKTTLAKIIMGLYNPQEFTMRLGSMTVTERTPKAVWQKKIWGRKAGMVFQHADEALNLQVNVKELFAGLPLRKKLSSEALRLNLGELFEGDITQSFLNKKVAYLSGGQKQRLNLLRTLIMDTDLIILDEPLNGLDFVSVKKVFDILEEKRRSGSALLLISHNEEIFDSIVDKNHVYYLLENV